MKKIAIHGVPRSGTSWLGEIFNSSPSTVYKYQPLFSYAFKHFLTPSSGTNTIEEFFDLLETSNDDFLDQTEARRRGVLPKFDKTVATHVVYKEVRYHHILPNLARKAGDDAKIILLARNPFSVIHSWLNAPREFRSDLGWTVEEEWRYALKKNLNRPEEFNGYEKWKEATSVFLSLQSQMPGKVRVVKYSDLVTDPLGTVKGLFAFVDLSVTQSTENFLDRSTRCENSDAYSVFRHAPADDLWKAGLPDFVVQEIKEELVGTSLGDYFTECLK